MLELAKQGQQAQKIERGVRRIQTHFAIETSSVTDTEYIAVDGMATMKHDVEQWLSTR